MELFSIGHSNHTIGRFIELLNIHKISAIADVRSSPYSRFSEDFNQDILREHLQKEGIKYVFLGKQLGARTKNKDCYVEGKAIYEKIASTDEFISGINRLKKGLEKYRISVMCAEKDPLTCHRAILVCRYMKGDDVAINHILGNGNIESHTQLERRMLSSRGMIKGEQECGVQLSLLPNIVVCEQDSLLQEAYRLHGNKIAYTQNKK
jgi:uncharacterized protein (DUF488 family)